jgi:hypothetical protein
MQNNRWSRNFDWVEITGGTSGTTWIQKNRTDIYDESRVIAVGDIYFKLNKYLTGVTFTYINSLNNIYNTENLTTGDGQALVNMYNEYDVIDSAFKNVVFVDAAADSNIDLNLQWFSINDVKLKPGHLVLLKNQTSEFDNDIYIVNDQYFLDNTDIISSRDKSEKFSCSVKLGKNADKQFFLVNNGDEFPTNFEPKYFIEGQSFILKNLVNYNLNSSSSGNTTKPKMIFTDYEFARKQLTTNYKLYNGIVISGITINGTPLNLNLESYSLSTPSLLSSTVLPSYLNINYHYNNYTIRTGTNVSLYGLTSDITNSYSSGAIDFTSFTAIPVVPSFDCVIGDYVSITIYSGITSHIVLNASTFIKNKQDNYIILEETIPTNILTSLNGTNFKLNNLNCANSWSDAIDKFSKSPYSEFYTVSAITYTGTTYPYYFYQLNIDTKDSPYNRYFDYDGLTFNFINDTQTKYFETENNYIKYNLYDTLNKVTPAFSTGFTFFNEYILTGFTYQYVDNNKIRIVSNLTGLTEIFKPYTYIYALGDTTQKTLIYDVNEGEIIIEKPALWNTYSFSNLTGIQNIDGLKIISDILYDVYINEDRTDWYIKRLDDERKYITKSYAELLTQNEFFRKNITGIIYENGNNGIILKLYTLENDDNLFFSSIDLIYVGADRTTRLPVPLTLVSGTTIPDWDVLIDGNNDDHTPNIPPDDTLDGTGPTHIIGEVFDVGEDVVLSGVNNPPTIYNIVDGGIDSVLP